MTLRYLSVCSGIEAASVAWHPLGWEPWAFSEIDPFASAVLAHRFRGVSNLGDMTRFEEWPDATIDLLVGGTPCQDYSVAGKRAGMAGERGRLTLRFIEIARRYRPTWIVWENVPGVLSSSGGWDFATLVRDLAECGYGWAYRVLDAQHVRTCQFPTAIPQRRRRVFLVGYLGSWRPPAAVLLEREGMRGDPPPRRQARQGAASTSAARAGSGGGSGGGLIAMAHGQGGAEIAFDHGPTLTCNHEAPIVAHALRAEGFDASEDGAGRGIPLAPVAFDCKGSQVAVSGDGATPTLRAMPHSGSHANAGGQLAVALDLRGREGDAIATGWQVRRLTPRECERLQGFPDDFTRIPWRGRPAERCPDGPRYRALGNSMAVNCMEWIGRRIEMVRGLMASAGCS